MSFEIIIDSAQSYLPATMCVQGFSVGVADLCLVRPRNIPACRIEVHADDTVYDVDIPSTRCNTVEELAALLNKHLSTFVKIEYEKNTLKATYFDEKTHIRFPHTLSSISGLPTVLIRSTAAERDVDLFGHLERVYLCCGIVEPIIVGSNYLHVMYYGKPEFEDNTPSFRRLTVGHLNQMTVTLLDANLDPIEVDGLTALLKFKSP